MVNITHTVDICRGGMLFRELELQQAWAGTAAGRVVDKYTYYGIGGLISSISVQRLLDNRI
jgi:hypothetical protein